MIMFRSSLFRLLQVGVIALTATAGAFAAHDKHHTNTFQGAKVNKGTVVHANENGKMMLTLSSDFEVPDTPAPHWQVVDSKGNTYLLNRLKIKGGLVGDKVNMTITVPAYIKDVAKVQIWCSWAEALLGEASFAQAVK